MANGVLFAIRAYMFALETIHAGVSDTPYANGEVIHGSPSEAAQSTY